MTAMANLCWIPPGAPPDAFPPPYRAAREPNGLLAVGGDLSPERLLYAYRHGIFPWFSDGQPVIWWSPDPRAVIEPDRLKISRSLAKTLRRAPFRITVDVAFEAVVRACAGPRRNEHGTWITREMIAAYTRLHDLGYAHSVECWDSDGHLAGGLYGIALRRLFCGESMFSYRRDASKVALAHLCRMGYQLIDCQIPNPHLQSLGALELPRAEFLRRVAQLTQQPSGADT